MKKVIVVFLLVLVFALSASAHLPFANFGEQEYPVGKGWNLVAFNDDIMGGDVSELILTAFWFDPIQRRYYEMLPNDQFSAHFATYSVEMQHVLSNSGMWVYATKDRYLPVDVGDMTSLDETFMLKQGWNVLAINPEMADVEARALPGDCTFDKVYFFHPGDQKWQLLTADDDFESNMVGLATAVKVREDCFLKETIGTPGAPPSLPSN